MQNMLAEIRDSLSGYLPNLLGALGILLVGWLAAMLLSMAVKAGLGRSGIGRLFPVLGLPPDQHDTKRVATVAGRLVFYLVLLLVLVAFFQTLKLTLITEPLNQLLNHVFAYAPQVLGAALIALLAWVVARLVRFLVGRTAVALGVDRRLAAEVGGEAKTGMMSRAFGETAYWLVLLLFLPAILDALDLEGLLEPVQEMTGKIFSFLPDLFAAALIVLFGWIVARILQRLVSGLLSSAGADRLTQRAGVESMLGRISLSGLAGYIVYFLVLVPVVVAGLDALHLDSVTQPATRVLETVLGAFPLIFGALLVLLVSYVVGWLVSGVVAGALGKIGFNSFVAKLGFARGSGGAGNPAAVVGYLVFAAIMLIAIMESFQILGFSILAELMSDFIAFLGDVALGLFIFAVALYVSGLAARVIRETGSRQGGFLAPAARLSILVLGAAMALRQMGLAHEIVTIAFAAVLGAVAVAAAIAFGVGGRDLAADQLRQWRAALREGRPES